MYNNVLVPGYENSKGTLKEIEMAKQLKTPVYGDIKEVKLLIRYM